MSTHQPVSPREVPLSAALQGLLQQQRYCLQAAGSLEAADAHVLAHALRFTARQETEQAACLRGLLGEDCRPPSLPPLPPSPEGILREAIAHEEASCTLLHAAARHARDTGHPRDAATLLRLAGTEASHARRFRQCLARVQDGSLLHSPRSVSWFCLACGDLHHGCDAPQSCEGCGKSRGHFIRSDFSPFCCG